LARLGGTRKGGRGFDVKLIGGSRQNGKDECVCVLLSNMRVCDGFVLVSLLIARDNFADVADPSVVDATGAAVVVVDAGRHTEVNAVDTSSEVNVAVFEFISVLVLSSVVDMFVPVSAVIVEAVCAVDVVDVGAAVAVLDDVAVFTVAVAVVVIFPFVAVCAAVDMFVFVVDVVGNDIVVSVGASVIVHVCDPVSVAVFAALVVFVTAVVIAVYAIVVVFVSTFVIAVGAAIVVLVAVVLDCLVSAIRFIARVFATGHRGWVVTAGALLFAS
jgi:hypothetical protein